MFKLNSSFFSSLSKSDSVSLFSKVQGSDHITHNGIKIHKQPDIAQHTNNDIFQSVNLSHNKAENIVELNTQPESMLSDDIEQNNIFIDCKCTCSAGNCKTFKIWNHHFAKTCFL